MPVKGLETEKSAKESADGNLVPVKNPIFKAEIVQYEDSDAPGSPIIASSGNDVNIIFTISREKFRKMALALFDRWEQDPGEELDGLNSSSNAVSPDEGNSEVSNNYDSDHICDSTKCDNATHSLESFTEERFVEKVYDYSSPDDIRRMDSELSLKNNEELVTKTDPKSPVSGLEKDSKDIKSDCCSSNETDFETGSSNRRKSDKIYEMKIKQCLCKETDGINEHCGDPDCQKLEKNSKLNQSGIQIVQSDSVLSYSTVLSEFSPSKETEDKLNVDANVNDYTDKCKELAEKELSEMFPAVKTEEINLTEIKSTKADGTFTKYFKMHLSNEIVVLKITTSDENFQMNTFKFKLISNDSVTHANNFTEETNLSSECLNDSSDFSNEKPVASKADSPEKNTENVLAEINEEKLENEEVYSPKKSNEINSANEENVGNQSTFSNQTYVIEQSLDLERSQELDEKEILDNSKITQPEVECSALATVVNSEEMNIKAKNDTKDDQSNVGYSRSECELTIEQSSKAEDILFKQSEFETFGEIKDSLSTTYSLPDTMEENSLEASENILQTITKESVDSENKLHKTDTNGGSTNRTHGFDVKILSPLEKIMESSYVGQDHVDNVDSLNIASVNLENKHAVNDKNALPSVVPQENLEIKSEGCERSLIFSFSEFVEDEKMPEEKPKIEKANSLKYVEDNVESELSGKTVSEENYKTEDQENVANLSEKSMKDSSDGTQAQSNEINAAVSQETVFEKTKFTDVPTDFNSEKIFLNLAETDSVVSETKQENNPVMVSDECSGKKSENIIKDFENKRKNEEIVETETLQPSKSNLKENLPDVFGTCVENESSELTDTEKKKESIEETAEDANKTESSIDISENDAEAYEITKCVPTNESESDVNDQSSNEVVGSTVAVPENVSLPNIAITQDSIVSQDQLKKDEHLEENILKDTLSEEKLGLENSIIKSETIVTSRFSTESAETAVNGKETNGDILHSETLGSSFISISETSKVDNSSFFEEPENVEDEESVADSETASERDILDTEDVKSIASESDDSKDSGSSLRDKRSKKHESEVDCAPTRVRAKRSALKLSEDVIPEHSVVSKSRNFRSSHVVASSKSTLKVSPASRSLRSKSLEPGDQPSKSNATSNASKSNTSDSEEANRRKRATTPEVVSKREIKTTVRSSPRKITRATSLNTTVSKTPKKETVARSNTEEATTSNSSSSAASVTKKRATKKR